MWDQKETKIMGWRARSIWLAVCGEAWVLDRVSTTWPREIAHPWRTLLHQILQHPFCSIWHLASPITMEYFPKNTLTQWLLDPANLFKTNFPFGYSFPFCSSLFHLENLDDYSASTWHQQNWWSICNKKHHTRPMATTSNQSICLPFSIFSILFHTSSPFLQGKRLLIILLVSDIPNHDGIVSQKPSDPMATRSSQPL